MISPQGISLRKPSASTIGAFLERAADSEFSYPQIGCTRSTHLPGYFVDRYRAPVGAGRDDFRAACAALRRWEMFRLSWIEPHPASDTIVAGENVAIVVRALGLYWLNACRIVYVAETDPAERAFGFAYGTLSEHNERGEERFWIVRDVDDRVWYELTAISRPGRIYTWLGLPVLRRLQRRFAADSLRAIERAVAEARSP